MMALNHKLWAVYDILRAGLKEIRRNLLENSCSYAPYYLDNAG